MESFKSDCSMKQLTILICKYIKKKYRLIRNKQEYANVSVTLKNVYDSGNIFVRAEIAFDGNTYYFNRHISFDEMVDIAYSVLKQSKCAGDINLDNLPSTSIGSTNNKIIFNGFTLYGNPCKEFIKLNHLLQKRTKKKLNQFDVVSTIKYGKGKSMHDFLCYQPNQCNVAIGFILENGSKENTFDFSVGEAEKKVGNNKKIYTSFLGLSLKTPTGRKESVMNVYPSSMIGK
jgi:hypothetical protein